MNASVSTIDFVSKGDIVAFQGQEYFVTKLMQVNYGVISLKNGKAYKLSMSAAKKVRQSTPEEFERFVTPKANLKEGMTVLVNDLKLAAKIYTVAKVNASTVTVFPLGGGTGYRVHPNNLTEVPVKDLPKYL